MSRLGGICIARHGLWVKARHERENPGDVPGFFDAEDR
jgi:hypothetical protein